MASQGKSPSKLIFAPVPKISLKGPISFDGMLVEGFMCDL